MYNMVVDRMKSAISELPTNNCGKDIVARTSTNLKSNCFSVSFNEILGRDLNITIFAICLDKGFIYSAT